MCALFFPVTELQPLPLLIYTCISVYVDPGKKSTRASKSVTRSQPPRRTTLSRGSETSTGAAAGFTSRPRQCAKSAELRQRGRCRTGSSQCRSGSESTSPWNIHTTIALTVKEMDTDLVGARDRCEGWSSSRLRLRRAGGRTGPSRERRTSKDQRDGRRRRHTRKLCGKRA